MKEVVAIAHQTIAVFLADRFTDEGLVSLRDAALRDRVPYMGLLTTNGCGCLVERATGLRYSLICDDDNIQAASAAYAIIGYGRYGPLFEDHQRQAILVTLIDCEMERRAVERQNVIEKAKELASTFDGVTSKESKNAYI